MAPSPKTALRIIGTRLLGTAIFIAVVVSAVYILTEWFTPLPGLSMWPSLDTVITERYPQFATDAIHLQFGQTERIHTSWTDRGFYPFNILLETTRIGTLLGNRLPMSLWLMTWTTIISVVIGVLAGFIIGLDRGPGKQPGPSAIALIMRGLAVVFVANLVRTLFVYSDRFFNVNWPTFLVEIPPINSGLGSLPPLLTLNGLLVATKWAIIPAIVASTAVIPTIYRVSRTSITQLVDSDTRYLRQGVGLTDIDTREVRHTRSIWLLEALPAIVALIIVSSLVAETYFRAGNGVARILGAAILAGESTLLAAVTALVLAPILVADLVREIGIYYLTGLQRRRPTTAAMLSLPSGTQFLNQLHGSRRVVGKLRTTVWTVPQSRARRIIDNPLPVIVWGFTGLVLLVVELGAIRDVVVILFPGWHLPDFPTLISWTTIPDAAYMTPDGDWEGGFLGLSPALAWTARMLIAALYVTSVIAWVWIGSRIARVIYGESDQDLLGGTTWAVVRSNDRIKVGVLIVVVIASIGIFAPGIAPSMADNPSAEFSKQRVTYLNPETGEVEKALMVEVVANMDPDGSPGGTVGLLEYDAYGRFHPLGVSLDGQAGKRVSSRTYDIFLNQAMNLQAIVRLMGLTTVLTFLLTLVFAVGIVKSAWLDQVWMIVADRAYLLPFFLVAVFTYHLPGAGPIGDRAFSDVNYRAVDPAMPWWQQPEFGIHHVVLATLVALALTRVIHRIAARHDADEFRSIVRDAVVPVLGHACLLLAGVVIIIVIGRLLRWEHPSAAMAFDIRVPLDFLWLDTALWYRHTVPMLLQFSLGIGLALLGDGLRLAAGDRADPESHAPAEANAGGGGG